MKKFFLLLLIIPSFQILISNSYASAPDEGMWLPMFIQRLNYEDMQKKGLKLTAEEIYSINHSSLKDAIVMLDGGQCTAELVSAEGLLFTNHHCGYNAIQSHSTLDNNYLRDGFWAMSKEQELNNEGMTASLLVRMEDVTEKAMKNVKPDMKDEERSNAIEKELREIEKEASEKGKYDVKIKSFFEGSEYYLFVYITYRDVRLVGAPPTSIGKFGGETDNWIWPRHTGDFCILRIYTDKEGNPASYSQNNIPLEAKYFLPVSIKGVKKNDYAMIMGYPGKTDRYLSSDGVNILLEQTAPTVVKTRDIKLKIMKEAMDADPAVKIKYAAKYAATANYWKYFIGQSKGLKRLNVYGKKKKLEDDFDNWITKSNERSVYNGVTKDISEAYKVIADQQIEMKFWYYQELFTGAEALLFSFKNFPGFTTITQNTDKKYKMDNEIIMKKAKEDAAKFFKDFDLEIEKKMFTAVIELYYKNVKKELLPQFLLDIEKKYKGDFKKYTDDIYDNSIFASEANFNKFLKSPKKKTLDKDKLYLAAKDFVTDYVNLQMQKNKNDKKLSKAKRLFIQGQREMLKDKKFYPDANSTMRTTYGQVLDYYPADAVHYNYQTTMEGIIEKEDPANEEFNVPVKLKELFKSKDFGQYAENGNLYTCFLTNTDITGGNSGSPCINDKGELIGIAFDGNWDAMSGDIAFEPELQRTINVDIRYVLFVIDKFAGARNLIQELKIVN